MGIRTLCRRAFREGSRVSAHRVSRVFQISRRSAVYATLAMAAALGCANLALAANPTITAVAFTGKTANLHVAISGTGFGRAPGVPCRKCSIPYLRITDGRGYGCQLFNITSWTDESIVFDGFEGNPGDSVLVVVTNPQSKLVGIRGGLRVPSSIVLASPTIEGVSFAGSIGPNMEITIVGSGFGIQPSSLPFDGNLPFFSFIDKPFDRRGWEAGDLRSAKRGDAVTLKYGLWLNNRIVIVGFGGSYGENGWKVEPNDPVVIAVAHSGTCGLNMNRSNRSMGPTSVAAVWGGHLP